MIPKLCLSCRCASTTFETIETSTWTGDVCPDCAENFRESVILKTKMIADWERRNAAMHDATFGEKDRHVARCDRRIKHFWRRLLIRVLRFWRSLPL